MKKLVLFSILVCSMSHFVSTSEPDGKAPDFKDEHTKEFSELLKKRQEYRTGQEKRDTMCRYSMVSGSWLMSSAVVNEAFKIVKLKPHLSRMPVAMVTTLVAFVCGQGAGLGVLRALDQIDKKYPLPLSEPESKE